MGMLQLKEKCSVRNDYLPNCIPYNLLTLPCIGVLRTPKIPSTNLRSLDQGSPTPGPQTSTSPWPVRNWATQQEVSSGRASEASSVSTATPHRSHYHLSSASCQHYGELYNYFIIYYNIIIIEIKCTRDVMHLNHPKTILLAPPRPWKNCLPRNWSLVPKRLGTTALDVQDPDLSFIFSYTPKSPNVVYI